MREVVFHRLASREYRAAKKWYQARSQRAYERFREAVSHAVERISAHPEMLSPLHGMYRYARVKRFPYILIFEILPDETAFVLALAHTSRRPGYWRRRK